MPAKVPENPRVCLLRGEDDYNKHLFLKELLDKNVTEEMKDFDFETLEGTDIDADRVIAALSACPFMAERRVTYLKNPNKMPEPEQKKLAEYIINMPETSLLIMTVPAAEKVDGRTKKGSEVVADLSKAAKKVGEVKDFGALKRGDAKVLIKNLLGEYGLKATETVITTLQQRLGTESPVIVSEIGKLRDYMGGEKSVKPEHVDAVISETPEEKIFKLVDAVAAQNKRNALKLMAEQMNGADDPAAEAARTLAMIARQYRLIFQAKVLEAKGVRIFKKEYVPEDVAALLPKEPNIIAVLSRQPWNTDTVKKQAKMSDRSVANAFAAIHKADKLLKGMDEGGDPKSIMFDLAAELCK